MIEELIENKFRNGLSYNETAQLCLRLYSSLEGVPEEYHDFCNKDDLAQGFAILSRKGFIKSGAEEASIYGANFHDINDKGHWIGVIASIFKIGETTNTKLGAELASCLTKPST